MEIILTLVVFYFVYSMSKAQLDDRAKERQQRLEALERALANPAVDRAMVQQLANQLTGNKPPQERAGTGLAWLLGLGWLTLFTGAGVWAFGLGIGHRDPTAAGILVMLIGFGLVTYPFALREMEARRAAR